MIILFEKFSYSLKYLKRVLPTDSAGRFKGLPSGFVGRDGVLDGVGYLYNSSETNEDEGKINPSDRIVFVLPKVFLDEAGQKAFGRSIPGGSEDEIDKDFQLNVPEDRYPKDFFSNLAMWVCSSIAQYRQENPQDKEMKAPDARNFVSDKLIPTLIDVKNAMKQFYAENHDLFVFIAQNKHCGNNHIDWRRTVARTQPFFQNGIPIYMDLVNKKKVFDLDDRLLVLYFSAMNYIEETFPGFKMPHSEFYTPMRVNEFRRLLGHRGLMELRRVKHKYFADKFLRLYNIMKAFFEWGGNFSANGFQSEYLLTSKYNNVFEAMIDKLVGDDLPNGMKYLKDQKDGKIIDHLYKDRQLIFADEKQKIWFIGDSKYYSDGKKIEGSSIYKQFTYAKNIIQYNISDLLNSGKNDNNYDGLRYRDELTEGYSVTPNFFIRGFLPESDKEPTKREQQFQEPYFRKDSTEDLIINEEDSGNYQLVDGNGNLIGSKSRQSLWDLRNRHFRNRLFDRDTLLLQVYNVNFLYVLKAYTSRRSTLRDEFKKKAREKFRRNFIKLLDNKFNFYKIIPQGVSLADFVDRRFRQWIGKMYCPENVPDDHKTFIIYAEEKESEELLNETTSNEKRRVIDSDEFICLPMSAQSVLDSAADQELNPDIFTTESSQELLDRIEHEGVVELPKQQVFPNQQTSVPKYLLALGDDAAEIHLFVVLSVADSSDTFVCLHVLEQNSYVQRVFDCDEILENKVNLVNQRMKWNDLPWRSTV